MSSKPKKITPLSKKSEKTEEKSNNAHQMNFESEFEKMRIQNEQMEKYLLSLEKNRELEGHLSHFKSENLLLAQQNREKNLLNDHLLN